MSDRAIFPVWLRVSAAIALPIMGASLLAQLGFIELGELVEKALTVVSIILATAFVVITPRYGVTSKGFQPVRGDKRG